MPNQWRNAGITFQKNGRSFLVLPARKRQEAFLGVGKAISSHFDYNVDFLQEKLGHYPELKEVFESAKQDPVQAYHASTVLHTDLAKQEWANLPIQIKKKTIPSCI